jgi:hypothetical protein
MDPLHATMAVFAADGYTHVEGFRFSTAVKLKLEDY